MAINSIHFLVNSIKMEGELPPEEQTTLVNETTTRVDPNVPETGEPVTPEPQINPELPSSEPEPTVEPEAPVVITTESETVIEGGETPPEAEPVEAETVELPAEVEPAEVEEVVTRVTEIVTQVEDTGVDPTTMKYINDAWGEYLGMFGLKLPDPSTLKAGSTNLRAAADVVNTFNKFKMYMRCFKK